MNRNITSWKAYLSIAVTAGIAAAIILVASNTTSTIQVTQLELETTKAQASIPAFPGAEGYGAQSVGGRGGKVIEVTNLNNSGTGSLRACAEASGRRICVFRTDGLIELESRITINDPYLTIAGQTAPGSGITLKASTDRIFMISTHNVVIRYLRYRGGGSLSFVTMRAYNDLHDVILDHVSAAAGHDDTIDMWWNGDSADQDMRNITVQNSIIAEAHISHPTGMITGGSFDLTVSPQVFDNEKLRHISIHNNYFVHNGYRNPLINTPDTRVINNVVYNFGNRIGGTGSASKSDWINNYFKKGPMSSNRALIFEWLTSGDCIPWPPSSIYIAGNLMPSKITDPNADNWFLFETNQNNCGDVGNPVPTVNKRSPFLPLASAPIPVTIEGADTVVDSVLADVGANQRLSADGTWSDARDSADQTLIDDYYSGTGPSSSPTVATEPASYNLGTPYADADKDGMADQWENLHFATLSRGSSSDSSSDLDGDGYTDLEEFLNGTDPTGGSAPPPPPPPPGPPPPPPLSSPTYTILKTATPPVIDGNITEFSSANTIIITEANQGNTGTYKLLWDDTALYIAASVSDTRLNATEALRDGNLWNDDSIELFFDTLHDGGASLAPDDYKFFVNLLNVQTDYKAGDLSFNTTFNSAVQTTGTVNNNTDTDTSYTIEIAIPWPSMALSPPVPDSIMGFDISMNNNDIPGTIQTAWANTTDDGNFNDPAGWGDLVYSGTLVNVPFPPPPPPPPPLSGLVAHWKLDESSGTTASDSSGNNNHGTLVNMSSSTDWVPGKLGNALDFDGINDTVRIPTDPTLHFGAGESFSFSSWVQFRGPGARQYIYRSSNIGARHMVERTSGNVVRFQIVSGTNDFALGTTNIADGKFHHVAATRDGSTGAMTLYIDGAIDATSVNNDSVMYTSQDYYIGSNANLEFYLNGQLDDLRFYSRLLTPTEIATLARLSPTISSLTRHHVYLDRVENITLSGSNLTGDFKAEFIKDGITQFSFSSLTAANDTLNLTFTSQNLSSLQPGEYTLKLTRITDNETTTYPKTFVFTKLGDIWSPTATDTSEQKRDGRIDIFDVSRMLAKWGSTSPADLQDVDINAGPGGVSSGTIDIYDANKLMANWTP